MHYVYFRVARAQTMSERELMTCLHALTGEDSLSGEFDSGRLAHEVLGFEERDGSAAGEIADASAVS